MWTLDILRVCSGIILFNALLSYFFTSTTLWGYNDTKYVDWNYLSYKLKGSPQINYTIESLFNEKERYLISINRTVFDVTLNKEMYDPSSITARYSIFKGKDCTRIFINGCFHDLNQCTWDLRNTGYDNDYIENTIIHWLDYYNNHPLYWKVGKLEVDENTSIPEKCMNGLMYPS